MSPNPTFTYGVVVRGSDNIQFLHGEHILSRGVTKRSHHAHVRVMCTRTIGACSRDPSWLRHYSLSPRQDSEQAGRRLSNSAHHRK